MTYKDHSSLADKSSSKLAQPPYISFQNLSDIKETIHVGNGNHGICGQSFGSSNTPLDSQGSVLESSRLPTNLAQDTETDCSRPHALNLCNLGVLPLSQPECRLDTRPGRFPAPTRLGQACKLDFLLPFSYSLGPETIGSSRKADIYSTADANVNILKQARVLVEEAAAEVARGGAHSAVEAVMAASLGPNGRLLLPPMQKSGRPRLSESRLSESLRFWPPSTFRVPVSTESPGRALYATGSRLDRSAPGQGIWAQPSELIQGLGFQRTAPAAFWPPH